MFKLIFYCLILGLVSCTCREAEFSYDDGILSSPNNSINEFKVLVLSNKKAVRKHVFKLKEDAENDSFYFFKSNDNYVESATEMGKQIMHNFKIEPNTKYELNMDRGSDCSRFNVNFQTDSLMKISPWEGFN